MGYGKKALKLLRNYFEGKFTSLDERDNSDEDDEDTGIQRIDDEEMGLLKEEIKPRKKVPTLLKRLTERRPEKLDYLGTSYGLTGELLKFWKSQKFVPVYLSQKTNDLTAEHSCIMISCLKHDSDGSNDWLSSYYNDFRRRILKLLGKSFGTFTTGLALSLLENKNVKLRDQTLSQQILDVHFLPHDVQRLESYTRNQIEYRLILDLTQDLGFMFFDGKLNFVKIDPLQKALILGVGLQNRTIDNLAEEFNMPGNQLLAKFYDCIKKLTSGIMSVMETTIEKGMRSESKLNMGHNLVPLKKSFHDELSEDVKVLEQKQKKELAKLKKENLDQYAIKGTEDEWDKVLKKSQSSIISIKSGNKRINDGLDDEGEGGEGMGKAGGDAKKRRSGGGGGGKKFGNKNKKNV